ncbi:MAG: 50S ribosomal protein L25/general stress protein Ctc [Bacteroidales bacterium]|nr:50S ribosomal protein L25/general stress protein Ctc [Bacteroidales bacterium]MCF8391988.1 50S ribosomal protein L25/general stress protein Ctc [Bacteroidales bacterium]
MKKIQISVKKREKLGKGETRQLRNQEMVPCVMYGGEKNYHFYAHENLFKKIVYSPEVFLVELDIEGDKHKALMQEIQFHPVTDSITHIDFVETFTGKAVVTSIPIVLTGASIGVKNGGKMRQRRRYLKVKGLVENLPDKLEIDITKLDVNQVIKIGDLNYPNLEILDPHRSMIVSVVSSRVAMKGMEATDPDAVEAEGAVSEAAEGTSAEDETSES